MSVHGSSVSRNGRAVLITGPSGAGKSQLALELIALGGTLVADDAVELSSSPQGVVLSCPPSIKGMIEARGIGLLSVNEVEKAMLAFVVDLDKTTDERLPEPKTTLVLGRAYPLICGKGHLGLSAVVWCLLGGGQILPSV